MMNKDKYEAKAEHRFKKKYVVVDNECWCWAGYKDPQGYGYFSYHCANHKAARYAYSHFIGIIPNGMHLDHLCRNTSCVNPAHLEPVSPRENTMRGVNHVAINAKKLFCIRGHELVEDNIQRKNGHRICLECRKVYNKQTYDRLYSAAANGGKCMVTLKKRETAS